jgi:hypothetical protein
MAKYDYSFVEKNSFEPDWEKYNEKMKSLRAKGYKLHTAMPVIVEGTTTGFTMVMELVEEKCGGV